MIRSRHARITAFLTPYLLGTLILIVFPAGISFYFAFTRYNGVANPINIGWQNFQFLLHEPLFKIALYNSLLFTVKAVPLRVLGALALALFYNRPRRAVGFYRAAAYLPTIIPDVAYALTWTWILNPLYGPLNASLRTLGLFPPPWLADSAWATPALILMSLFQIGEGFVILLVGLRHIPRETYDAARVDGANHWQTFTRITLPLLSPWLILLTVRDIVLSFQNTFAPAYIMTRGGPNYATFFLPLLVYETAFDGLRFGQAAAVMLIIFIYTLLLVILVYLLFEGWGFDEE
ncbi:MAG: sugar ABC transporter permease [Chloroflexota bacterium]